MKNLNTIYITLTTLLLISACSDDITDIESSVTPVISGYLYAGHTIDSMRVTASNRYGGSTELVTLDDLEISVSDSTFTYTLTSIGNGYYRLPAVDILNNESYTLSFEWNNSTVEATTFVPAINQVTISDTTLDREQESGGFGPGGGGGFNPGQQNADNIELSWDNSNGDYYFVLIENLEEDAEYINTFFADLINQGDTLRRPFIRTEPEIVDFHIVDSRRDIQQFGRHQVVIYRLNAEYAALYETIGSSSLSLTPPPTNVENGLGIFTGISTDTVYFEVRKL